ncbi:hypothetical protein ACEPPU_24075 [Priestia aryabhattai]|uniref:hypothetical protein n=1 Tax=Priestia aryabhattai TaxID=412384 RepID=UPI0035AB9F65
MDVTIEEAFGLMCMVKDKREFEQDEKEIERYIRYQSLKMVQPFDSKDMKAKKALEEFEKHIMPSKMKQRNGVSSKPARREYKWDFEDKE